MKNTKKLIALMMAITLIVMAFAACTAKKPDEPETTKPDTEATSEEATKAPEKETEVAPIEDETKTSEKEDETEATKPVEEPKTEAKEDKPVVTEAPKPKTTEAPKPKQDTPKTTEAPKPKTTEAPKPKTTEAPKPKTTEAPKPKPESKPTENQYGYFTASTGESIRYCTYAVISGKGKCTGISESNGKITATYQTGANGEWFKCSNCGKYLCEGGCEPETEWKCPKCGRSDCIQRMSDGPCPGGCGKQLKAWECHHH